jgi:preprotein translocase subunit YajC
MYFLIIRPQNKRIKAQKEMIDNLAVGDEIISSGGLVCTISKISDDFLTVRANDTQFTIKRDAVSSILPKGTINSI